MTQTGQSGRRFIGRQREMSALKGAVDAATTGDGRIVMLAGEPGIGKTRLAQELSSYAESSGAQVWWGSCIEQQGAPPYWPWVQPIRSYVQLTAADSLAAQMGPGAADISEIIPEVVGKMPDLEPASPLDPEQARFRLFDSISRFLGSLAQSQPVVLVLDDLQWADQPSLMFLEFLASQLTGKRILILGTYRDIEVNREHPLFRTLAQLARSGSYHREGLGGLELEQIGQLIGDISGSEPSQELVQAIFEHTDGNPFFMTEIIRLLEEKRLSGGHTATTGLEDLEIPPGVLEVIGQRLNRLSTECEGVLTTAAVIGREFDFELLGSLSEEATESQLLALIDEALDASLVQEVAGHRDIYQFSHALVQQTLRERLSNSRRVRLHLKIGETLETLFGDKPNEYAAELAYHFAEAAPVAGSTKLVEYALLAGERALETYAHEDALEHFQRGLVAKDLDQTGSSPAPDAEAAALFFGLGRAQAATLLRKDLDIAFSSLRRAFEFYAETNDVARAVKVAGYPLPTFPGNHLVAIKTVTRALQLVPSDSPEAGYLLSRAVLVMGLEEADYQGAMESFNDALDIARRTGDAALETRTMLHSSWVDYWHLKSESTVEKGLRAIEMAQAAKDQTSEVSARFWVGYALLFQGQTGEAQAHASAGLAMGEILRDRYRLAAVLWLNELIAIYKGDWQLAREFNDWGLSVSPSDPRHSTTRLLVEYETGSTTGGQHYVEQLVEALRLETPGPRYLQAFRGMLIPLVARITGTAGELDVAEGDAASVISAKNATPQVSNLARLGLGLIAVLRGDTNSAMEQYANLDSVRGSFFVGLSGDRALGLLAQTMGDLDQASAHYEAAMASTRKAGYKPELAWTCHDYAVALLERDSVGDRARAHGLLEESISIASELLMQPLMARVTSIRQPVESNSLQTTSFPDGLTQREIDVIRLVAAGRTDREIADDLIIGVRTVSSHVGSILSKTGAANRAEAASYAVRNGLG